MNFAEAIKICDSDLRRRNVHDRAIYLMKCMDVLDASTSEYLDFQPEVSKFCVPWPWYMSKRGHVSAVDNLGELFRVFFLEVECSWWRRT